MPPHIGVPLQDKTVRDLPEFLQPGDVMVFNDTRVIPARLFGRRGEAKVEVTLHKELAETTWQVFAKPAKKLKTGDIFTISGDFNAQVREKLADGQLVLEFTGSVEKFRENLQRHGTMPLPPYMQRAAKDTDRQDYQTVYARNDGSVAAPTAGLHFTPNLLTAIDKSGVERAHVTLHVGGGTFLPVKVEDTNNHLMHSEYAELTNDVADRINQAKREGRRIVAVGTTSLRTLESAADETGMVRLMNRETDIFITPGYKFRVVDLLLTNFHLPRSTLFMLVSAFSGLERMKEAYAHAIAGGYRFYSYGDACLLYLHDEQN